MADIGEETQDFDIGVFSALYVAIKLEDSLVTIEDAGIGLLGGGEARGLREGKR